MKSLAGSPYHIETEYYRYTQENVEMPYVAPGRKLQAHSTKQQAQEKLPSIFIPNLTSSSKPCPVLTLLAPKSYFLQIGQAQLETLGSSFVEIVDNCILVVKKQGRIQAKVRVSLGKKVFEKALTINAVSRIIQKGRVPRFYYLEGEE